jgi:predicted O-methyltransferase YrrM
MDHQEFIDFCYQNLLRRDVDPKAKSDYGKKLENGEMSHGDLLLTLINSDEFKAISESQEFVSTGHYYSPVPSKEDRDSFIMKNADEKVLGIDLNIKAQSDLLKNLSKYVDECPFTKEKNEKFRYYFENAAYNYTDGLMLYAMMRNFQPKHIIEVGSGFSSCAMLDTDEHFLNGKTKFTFIEPEPALLKSLINKHDQKHKIIEGKLQDVDLEIFNQLQANDILFIDSTHVSKLNSDVNKIIHEILPALNSGVIIHFHDIFWPFEYTEDWVQEGRAWNEAYILRAFLQFNNQFEILFFSDYLAKKHEKIFHENLKNKNQNTGGNIWIRKI